MDLKHTTTTPLTAPDSPDTDTDTPLHSHQIQHFSSFPIQKNHHHHHHRLQPPPTVVAYKECLKNHAATIGSHALDGCGEFMPSLTCTPHEPTSLKCAACGCHRNFHRREPTNDVYTYTPHLLLPFNTTDHHTQMVATPGTPAAVKLETLHGRKRFRTKFTQIQKEKMYFFAEKVGWKMQRCDDKMVADFCNEIGIKRGVFKVWMHNNKNTFGKKEKETVSASVADTLGGAIGTTAGAGNRGNDDIYNSDGVIMEECHEEDENVDGRDDDNSYRENGGGGCGGGVDIHASNNGSSSSC
ncbi:putative transcription factor ZF-HD family [Helianthus annuus]|nr:putative transcription factor ZF-HD family [Helianthus annuus]